MAINQIIDLIPSLVVRQSVGMRRRRTAIGSTFFVQAGGGKDGEDGSGGMIFKGTYDPEDDYSFDDVVRVDTGVHAGTYVAIEDVVAGESPWDSEKWVLIGRIKDNGLTAG